VNPLLQVLAALALLAVVLPGLAAQQDPTAQRQSELRALLHQDCGSCHGMTLQGGLGPPLLPSAIADKPDALLVETILIGRSGTAMPPWNRFLSSAEAGWLVRQLRANPLPPTPSVAP
jgi:cytochrome c55X